MDEYISKQKVLDYLNDYLLSLGNGGADTLLFDRGQRRALINSIQDISAIEAADVQLVKHGRWINEGFLDMYCSVCGETPDSESGSCPTPTDFCGCCGAIMDGDSDA